MKGSTRLLGFLAMFLMFGLSAFAGDGSQFNYQGRVLVQGFPYTGPGQMKVAILATTGTSTVYSLWSNDGSSVAGAEPTGAFGVTATGGVFDVMLGDSDLMQEIPAIIFNRDDELKVRVWFNDGTHGFQQLTPDRRITNPRRLGLTRVKSPLVIFVSSIDGDDMNDGLTTKTAKRTVGAALDMLPRSIYANTTVTLAAGTYTPFYIRGFADIHNTLVISGDKIHNPTQGQALDVTVNGNGGTGISIAESMNIRLEGVAVTGGYAGLEADGAEITCRRCRASGNSLAGFWAQHNSFMIVDYCYATANGRGFQVEASSTMTMGSSIAEGNGTGLLAYWNSNVCFVSSILRNNTSYGILSRYQAAMAPSSGVTITGNGTNTDIMSGSAMYN
ncbi:right-handed parallel beta-helix repeat-containing protein [bacterium]|nr:right-handed parallel beta-helix repeat-containing protein [bacterium]